MLADVSAGVLIGMHFRSFFMMMNSMKMVPVSYVSMMAGFFMIAFLMMLGCFTMVCYGMLQMFGSFAMVFDAFRHDVSPIDIYKAQSNLTESDFSD